MARPLRIEYEGAFYHVTARGNQRKRMFLSMADNEKFLTTLKDTALRLSVVIHCYVLTKNHYHLLVERPRKQIPAPFCTLFRAGIPPTLVGRETGQIISSRGD